MSDPRPSQLVVEMRKAFDESFASAPATEAERYEDLLAIRTQETHLALRTRDIAAVLRCPQLTPVPSQNSALCGLAGVRGAIVAVYDVTALLGGMRGAIEKGWIVSCAADRSIALLFEQLVGHSRVRPADILASYSQEGVVKEVVELAGAHRVLLDVSKVVEAIRGFGARESSGAGEDKE